MVEAGEFQREREKTGQTCSGPAQPACFAQVPKTSREAQGWARLERLFSWDWSERKTEENTTNGNTEKKKERKKKFRHTKKNTASASTQVVRSCPDLEVRDESRESPRIRAEETSRCVEADDARDGCCAPNPSPLSHLHQPWKVQAPSGSSWVRSRRRRQPSSIVKGFFDVG